MQLSDIEERDQFFLVFNNPKSQLCAAKNIKKNKKSDNQDTKKQGNKQTNKQTNKSVRYILVTLPLCYIISSVTL